jgi:hypothetical protein
VLLECLNRLEVCLILIHDAHDTEPRKPG